MERRRGSRRRRCRVLGTSDVGYPSRWNVAGGRDVGDVGPWDVGASEKCGPSSVGLHISDVGDPSRSETSQGVGTSEMSEILETIGTSEKSVPSSVGLTSRVLSFRTSEKCGGKSIGLHISAIVYVGDGSHPRSHGGHPSG